MAVHIDSRSYQYGGGNRKVWSAARERSAAAGRPLRCCVPDRRSGRGKNHSDSWLSAGAYTLVEIYATPGVTAVHLDLYRLSDPAELDNLGLREWASAGHLWLIEWPERSIEKLPAPDLVVKLTAGAAGHDIEVSSATAPGASWLDRMSR
jgi:hypothetical protein